MRRILVLTPQLPFPPMQGTSLRNWHNLRALAEDSTLTLLSFAERPAEPIAEQLLAMCEHVEVVAVPQRSNAMRLRQLLMRPESDLVLRLESAAFSETLRHLLDSHTFDAVQIEGLELAGYMPLIREERPSLPIVLDAHNVETVIQRRAFEADISRPARWPAAAYSRIQSGRLASSERQAVQAADRGIAVSELDAENLSAIAGSHVDQIAVIPNSIDVKSYAAEPLSATVIQHDLLFTGKMDYRPNLDAVGWFAADIWPGLRAANPSLTLAVVGQQPPASLDALRPQDGIIVTGRVEKVQPYLAGATVFIVPLRMGSGTRLKLLEAMAAGTPIVTTSLGAEGLPVVDGQHVLVANTAEAFQLAVQQLLDSPDLREKLVANSRELVAAFDWRNNVSRFRVLYDDLLGTV